MKRYRFPYGITGAVLALLFLCAISGLCPATHAAAGPDLLQASDQGATDSALIILNDSQLPEAYPLGNYEVQLLARGGAPPVRWHLEKGALPPGIELDPNGRLHGETRGGGEFHFTLSVHDSSNQRAQKEFVILVQSALEVKWKSRAHVNGNRIDGSVEVSNATRDDIDLTFIVLAVAPNGRATAIGYQHFPLRRGTIGEELPFGDTLAHGAYIVHVDAVGEVASRNVIYREHLETHTLDVAAGP